MTRSYIVRNFRTERQKNHINNIKRPYWSYALVLTCLWTTVWAGGCTPIQAVIPIADTVNYAAEGQFVTDKWVSQWYGKQCSLANFLEDSVMCRDNPPDTITAPVYCYKTLGKPECFESPDPFDPRRPLLGGLAQQRRQAERYQQYRSTGTRWPLKPLGEAGRPAPVTKSNPGNQDIDQNNAIQQNIINNSETSDSIPTIRP